MKKELNLLDHFDRLNAIEPTDEWNERLLLRLDETNLQKHDLSGSRWVLYAIFLLLVLNLFSFSKSWMDQRSRQNAEMMRNLASDFLITSNSSKY